MESPDVSVAKGASTHRNTLAENIFRYFNRRREERDSDGDGKRS